jgi:surface antigen
LTHNAVRKTSKWTNKNNGAKYTMTPMSQTMTYNGHHDCRKYHSTVNLDGKQQVMNGVACRQENGNWQAVNS